VKVKVFLTSTTVVLNHFAPQPFNSALLALYNTAEARKLFIPRDWNGANHPLKCNFDHIKELHVLRSCPFPLSRRHNRLSFQLKMKDEKKMSFCTGRKTHRRKISWLFRRKMQLRMSETSDSRSLQTQLF